MMQEETPQQKLGERGLGDILNETFAVYGRRFKKLVALTAVVQVPLSIMTLLLALLFSNDPVASGALAVIAVGVGIFSYGALICAVGQHYVLDDVSVSGCYTRVLWRAVSIAMLAALVALLLILVLAPLLFTSQDAPSPLALFSLMFGVVLIVYLVYQTFMIPAVIVEGYRFSGAIRRGFNLARGSELRIVGHLAGLWTGGVGYVHHDRCSVPASVSLCIRGRGEPCKPSNRGNRSAGCGSTGSASYGDRCDTPILRPSCT